MLVTLSRAAKSVGMPIATIYWLKRQSPMPAYFIKLDTGQKSHWRLDDAHPEWIAYSEDYKQRKAKEKELNEPFERLVDATVQVIKLYYKPSDQKLNEILLAINEKWQNAS